MQVSLLVIYSDQPKIVADWYQLLELDFIYHRHGKGSWHYSCQIKGQDPDGRKIELTEI